VWAPSSPPTPPPEICILTNMRIDIHMYSGSTNALSSRSYPFACPFNASISFFVSQKQSKNQSRPALVQASCMRKERQCKAQNGMRFFDNVSLRIEESCDQRVLLSFLILRVQ
jgi:hypothetical protein